MVLLSLTHTARVVVLPQWAMSIRMKEGGHLLYHSGVSERGGCAFLRGWNALEFLGGICIYFRSKPYQHNNKKPKKCFGYQKDLCRVAESAVAVSEDNGAFSSEMLA